MTRTDKEIRSAVRSNYATIALTEASCCSPAEPEAAGADYDTADLSQLPDEAIMGLGCGNPVAMAGIVEGETVLDLGSGGGIDVFLAARLAGSSGRVIGVDMTAEMLERAEANAARAGLENIEFRQGLIEALPVEDTTVDVIISNCVINLAPDKARVFAEAFRVLRPGGRLVVSDMVTSSTLPDEVRDDLGSWASCVGGAIPQDDYLAVIADAGFTGVEVLKRDGEGVIVSATVRAFKPQAPQG